MQEMLYHVCTEMRQSLEAILCTILVFLWVVILNGAHVYEWGGFEMSGRSPVPQNDHQVSNTPAPPSPLLTRTTHNELIDPKGAEKYNLNYDKLRGDVLGL